MVQTFTLMTLLFLCISSCHGKGLGESCSSTKRAADVCTIANSECSTNTCACKSGYTEENKTCLKALGQTCSTANVCVSNSKCEGTTDSMTCSCADGFSEKSGLCVKVFGRACGTGNDCPADSNTKCVDNKCVCDVGYAIKNDVCTKTVSSIDCSSDPAACDGIDNAVCETGKCTCNQDSTMNVDKCDPKNAAALIENGFALLLLSILTTYLVSSN